MHGVAGTSAAGVGIGRGCQALAIHRRFQLDHFYLLYLADGDQHRRGRAPHPRGLSQCGPRAAAFRMDGDAQDPLSGGIARRADRTGRQRCQQHNRQAVPRHGHRRRRGSSNRHHRAHRQVNPTGSVICAFLPGNFLQSLFWCGLRAYCASGMPAIRRPSSATNTAVSRAVSGFALFCSQKIAFSGKNAHFCKRGQTSPQALCCLVYGLILCVFSFSRF